MNLLWAWPVGMWVWLATPPLPHLTEDEHPPELAASPVSCQLLLDLLCVTKQEGEDGVTPPALLPPPSYRLPTL